MSTFSFSTIQKAVNPAEVELRKEWEEISKKVVDEIAKMPEDVLDQVSEQAQSIHRWGLLMVSDIVSAASACIELLSANLLMIAV
jgi:hypothetical protein